MARGDVSALSELTPTQAIEALQKLCHDLLALHSGATPRFFEAADLPSAGSLASLTQWSKDLAKSLRTAEHPYNPGLMLEALAAGAQMALRSRA